MSMNRNRWIVMTAATAAVLGGAGALVAWGPWRAPRPPDPNDQSPQEIVEYMASKEFGRLPVEARSQYMSRARDARRRQGDRGRVRRDELSDQQRRRLRENMHSTLRAHMEQRLNEYFELPPGEQTAYLDRMIDRMYQRRERRDRDGGRADAGRAGRRDGDSDRHRRGGRRGPTPERLKRRLEHSTPEMRAKFVEFRKALRRRMEERGIEPGRRGPRG